MAISLAIIAVVVAVTVYRGGVVMNTHATRFVVAPPRGTSLPPGGQPVTPAMSPDGSRLVFRVLRGGEALLAIRALDSLESQVLAGTERARFPFWSPDGRVIAFFADGELKKMSSSGGPVQTICEAELGFGGTWNGKGLIVFAPSRTEGLFEVPATGGRPSRLTSLQKNETFHHHPQFLPDGRRFLYFAAPNTVYLGSLDRRPPIRVLTSDRLALYSPPGYLLHIQGRRVLAQRFDLDRVRLFGDPVQIGENMRIGGPGAASMSVSESGVLAYTADAPANVRLAWVDRAGREVESSGAFPFGGYSVPELSPDGSQIALESPPVVNSDVWLFDLRHGRSTQLTFDPAADRHPIWSPDGSRVAFFSQRGGVAGLYQKVASGDKPEELILRSMGSEDRVGPWPWDWSAQGILYQRNRDLWLLPLAGERKPYALLRETSNEIQARFSPDTRWFAYTSDRSGREEVFVESFPPSGAKWRISTGGGSLPRWRHDGKELFYIAANGALMSVPLAPDAASLRPGVPESLFQTGLNGLGSVLQIYNVSSDGQRFLITRLQEPGAISSIVVVSNWPAALKP